MLLRLCQLKSPSFLLTLALLTSCSWRKNPTETPEILTVVPNKWFSVSPEHSLVDRNGQPQSHLLFDASPEFVSAEGEVNVVVATSNGSKHAYTVDLNSGQRHYTHSYCSQKDVWNESGTVNSPPFAIAYIPRVLDQLGDPQKVIVWSKRKEAHEGIGINYLKVRLIGAYVEHICPEGNCLGRGNWLSKMVFLGVDSHDKTYDEIKTIKDFQFDVNWKDAKAALGNIDGRNFIGGETYPAVKVGELIEFKEAFDYFKKRSIFLSDQELKKIQKGCHALYDGLWEEVGKFRPEDQPANTIAELNSKLKLREELKKKKVPVGFAERMHVFTKKYFKEISTCEKFVYHGNINKDPEKFWFLSYMGLYFRLHREGYYFDCKYKSWQRNVLNDQGIPVYDLVSGIDQCKEKDFDQAMELLPNFLTGLKGEKEYYRFIDYDNHTYGTHQKMYTWVKFKSRRFDCSNDPNEKFRKDIKVFPEDVTWKNRDVKDIATKMKIIYR